MAISDKLTYLNITKGNIKDAINLTNANILSEDTFRSYAEKLKLGLVDIINNGTSDLYDSFPKTTGTGTEIALNDTYEAPMEIGLKGNTQQDSYTGKNLCSSAELQSAANVRFYIDKKIEKTLTISFTINESLNNNSLYLSATNTLATTITADANTKATATFTLSDEQYNAIQSETNSYFLLYKSHANFTVPTDAQIENGSTPTPFEPFVGGIPSPNPDYPQQIEVVTGNNTINVSGKNLFDKTITKSQGDGRIEDTTLETGKKLTWNGSSSTSGYMWLGYVIKDISNYVGKTVRFKTNFSASASNTPQYAIGICDSDGDNRTSKATSLTSGNTLSFTIPSLSGTQTYLYVLLYANSGGTLNPNDYVDYTDMILTIDNEDMTYQPYQSKDYEISLKSKNLFDKNTMTMTNTFVNPEIGSSNGFTSIYTPCTPNTTYTISKAQETSRFYVGTTETLPTVGMTATVVSSSATGTTKTFTTGANANYIVAMVRSSSDTLTEEQIVAGIQIEENSTATEYEEFYDYKLCKINDYKDKIDKSTGKNLLPNFESLSNTGQYQDVIRFTDLEPSTEYTLKVKGTAGDKFYTGGSISYSSLTIPSNGVLEFTFTTNSTISDLAIIKNTTATNTLPLTECTLCKGSTATYEPYGEQWYIKKNIGKVVLDGTEGWDRYSATQKPVLYLVTENFNINYKQESGLICYCDNFKGVGQANSFDDIYDYGNNVIGFRTSYTRLVIRDDSMTTTTDFKTWLSTHNTTLYYVLDTPTYEIITNETLISQLEELEKAKSVDDKTFISQTNANLPFIISASALSKN